MASSFVVYIDESGDEGFRFDKGSPEWFVLSAVVTRKQTDLETVKLIDHVRNGILGRSDQNPLHFAKLKHEHRIPYINEVAQADLKAIVVAVYKPHIINIENFQQRNRLYFYASRLLLERVSWYCRDQAYKADGDGTADIIFSNRGGMKYDEFRDYMNRLKYQDTKIHWGTIVPEQITAYGAKRMGLQIADAIASGFFFGLRLDQYGFSEDRYVRMLQPVMYKHNGLYQGYGIKLWPREAFTLPQQKSHLTWLRDVYDI